MEVYHFGLDYIFENIYNFFKGLIILHSSIKSFMIKLSNEANK